MHCRFCGNDIPSQSERGYQQKRIDAKFCNKQCKTDYHNTRRKLARKRVAAKKISLEIWALERHLQWDTDD